MMLAVGVLGARLQRGVGSQQRVGLGPGRQLQDHLGPAAVCDRVSRARRLHLPRPPPRQLPPQGMDPRSRDGALDRLEGRPRESVQERTGRDAAARESFHCFERVHAWNLLTSHLQFEIALRNVARNLLFPTAASERERAERQQAVPEIQLQLRSGSRLMQFRELGVSPAAPPFPLFGLVLTCSVTPCPARRRPTSPASSACLESSSRPRPSPRAPSA